MFTLFAVESSDTEDDVNESDVSDADSEEEMTLFNEASGAALEDIEPKHAKPSTHRYDIINTFLVSLLNSNSILDL